MQQSVKISNKRAYFDYQVKDTYVAGIALLGTEVKALRDGKGSLNEAYCFMHNDEIFLRNANISVFKAGSYNNHEPLRERKLLLEKKEIQKIKKAIENKGFTLIPLELFLNEKGLFKIKIGIAIGKKSFDKREDLKLKDHKREISRAMKVR
jgi:SsrA-binding protein